MNYKVKYGRSGYNSFSITFAKSYDKVNYPGQDIHKYGEYNGSYEAETIYPTLGTAKIAIKENLAEMKLTEGERERANWHLKEFTNDEITDSLLEEKEEFERRVRYWLFISTY